MRSRIILVAMATVGIVVSNRSWAFEKKTLVTPECAGKIQAAASRVNTSTESFKTVLGPILADKASEASLAALYAATSQACASAAAGGSGMQMQGGGPESSSGACQAAFLVATTADPHPQTRTYAGVQVTMASTIVTANFHLNRLLSGNPKPEVRRVALDLLSALQNLDRESQCLKSPPPSLQPPAPLTSFDAVLGSLFNVHLDSGNAVVGDSSVTLDGGVTIALQNAPSAKVVFSGRLNLGNATGSSSMASGGAMQSGSSATLAAAGAVNAVGQPPAVRKYRSLDGRGRLRVVVWGLDKSLDKEVALSTVPSGGLGLKGGELDLGGCVQSGVGGGLLDAAMFTMSGHLACGSIVLNSSELRVTQAGRIGGGMLTLFGHTYDMAYDLGRSSFSARGSHKGPTTGWKRVPGVEAEFRVESPVVDVTIDGSNLIAMLDSTKVEVRTTATRNGQPWAQASLDPKAMKVAEDGNVWLQLVSLPSPQDLEKTARDTCLKAANKLPPGDARNVAVSVCNADHPSPPGVPSIPSVIQVKLDSLVK